MLNQKQLIETMIHLHDLPKGRVAKSIGVNASNFVNWLKGNPKMYIAEEFQLETLKYLGVKFEELLNSRVHIWKVRENIEDVRQALTTLAKYQLSKAEIYSLHPGSRLEPDEAESPLDTENDVVIKLPGDKGDVWIIITRPLMKRRPPVIDADFLGILHSYQLNARQWIQGLKEGKSTPGKMAEFFRPDRETELNKYVLKTKPLTEAFDKEFGTPPPAEWDELFGMSEDQQRVWNKVMLEALAQGISFKRAVSQARSALGVVKKRSKP